MQQGTSREVMIAVKPRYGKLMVPNVSGEYETSVGPYPIADKAKEIVARIVLRTLPTALFQGNVLGAEGSIGILQQMDGNLEARGRCAGGGWADTYERAREGSDGLCVG